MLRTKKIIPLRNQKKLKKSKRLMMNKIKKRISKRGSRTVCTLNLSQYFKDSTEKVRVEKLYPEIVQKDFQESIFESDLFTTFYTTEKDDLEGHDQSDETPEEEDTSDDGQELDQDDGQALIVETSQEAEDNRWTLSLLDVAQEITIGGTDQEQHDMGSSTSCQATEILDPRQWSQFIPREKPTFEYHDLDIHYEIPKEVLQLQIYDYCQWISKNKEV